MILLVPISPEVPPKRAPKLWQGLVLMLVLSIIYTETEWILKEDLRYIQRVTHYLSKEETGKSPPHQDNFLALRPLQKIAPAKASWDFQRLFVANFLHGSTAHLIFNLIGAFASARVCSTFMGLFPLLSIFILGGSIGLLVSILLSTPAGVYIPHIGASAGIFALFGAYYSFNLRFRTRYFFWVPSRSGTIALKTSSFFFFDAILLELILSSVQFLPGRNDSVDHVAHIVGFASGISLSWIYRAVIGWPSFIQTRGEYKYWTHKKPETRFQDPILKTLRVYLDLLSINSYNDHIKTRSYWLLIKHKELIPENLVEEAFDLASPTFIRRNTDIVTTLVESRLMIGKELSSKWLKVVPYDSAIRIAHQMSARNPENASFLLNFISAYRKAHEQDPSIERKLELLTQKLNGMLIPSVRAGSSTEDKSLPGEAEKKAQ